MAVYYSRGIIAKGAKVRHFKEKGVSIKLRSKGYPNKYQNFHKLSITFSRGVQLAVIRTSCYGNTFCIDVYKDETRGHHGSRCITTECKSLQECKDIIYVWFKWPNYPNY